MKGTVVYHSYWGSCKRIAEAIGTGLVDSGHDARVVAVEDAGKPAASDDFIIIGSATRWPGAWPKTKRYARRVVRAGFAGKPFAAFSTGGSVFDDEPNKQASELLYEILEKGGLKPLAPPLKIGIEGYEPPGKQRGTLPESEIARAEEFGRELGRKLSGT